MDVVATDIVHVPVRLRRAVSPEAAAAAAGEAARGLIEVRPPLLPQEVVGVDAVLGGAVRHHAGEADREVAESAPQLIIASAVVAAGKRRRTQPSSAVPARKTDSRRTAASSGAASMIPCRSPICKLHSRSRSVVSRGSATPAAAAERPPHPARSSTRSVSDGCAPRHKRNSPSLLGSTTAAATRSSSTRRATGWDTTPATTSCFLSQSSGSRCRNASAVSCMQMRSVSTCTVSLVTWPPAAASAAWAERTNASRTEKNSRSWSRRTWTARLTAPVERQSERHRDERRLVDAASFAGTKCRTRWRRSSGRSEIRSTAAAAAIVDVGGGDGIDRS
uniref:Uncharacterized protein n=1 Tax=Oryza barthii TaxID=65489 RepID=A0A0D3HMQ1_9ORYZ